MNPHQSLAIQALEEMKERWLAKTIGPDELTQAKFDAIKAHDARIDAAIAWVKQQTD